MEYLVEVIRERLGVGIKIVYFNHDYSFFVNFYFDFSIIQKMKVG